ncbi:hypothetical protein HHL25_08465 [Rhizobium sp. S-51]|uniref:Uncharacterized protein n=1 Tax=Rhizobium terricola TaxID=2728849 RepID=A0A7Y0AVD4_9HYPH|nr:hypothetical protein [Rhizobium terricola]NML74153.1 hypothetical protein [Rhizobium terricola]
MIVAETITLKVKFADVNQISRGKAAPAPFPVMTAPGERWTFCLRRPCRATGASACSASRFRGLNVANTEQNRNCDGRSRLQSDLSS